MPRAVKKHQVRVAAPRKSTIKKRRTAHHVRRIKSAARRHYYTYMPNKKHHRILVWVVFLLLAGQYAVQMLYPLDRAVPLARIAGQLVGWQQDANLAKRLADHHERTKISLYSDKETAVTVRLGELGAEPQIGAQTEQLENYPFWQRLIPFSIFFQMPHVESVQAQFAPGIFSKSAKVVAAQLSHPPKNARVSILNGKVVAVDDQPGRRVDGGDVMDAVINARLKLGTSTHLNVASDQWSAKTTAADFRAVRAQAEAALARTLTISIDDEVFQPTRSKIASWLVIGEENDQPRLVVDSKKITRYLEAINKKVGSPAGKTNIELENGREVDRQTGKSGKAVDIPPLIAAIRERLLTVSANETAIEGRLVVIEPSVIYNNEYTSSEAGLRAYVQDAAREQNANIVVRQLDGQRWYAADSADSSIPSASTYKLFVAKILFDKMDRGETNWNDPILDTNVSTCFDRMTIASTNPCAQEWLRRWGRDYVNQYIWKLGFSRGTTFTAPDAVHTTAGDLAKFMVELEKGTIINGAHRERLLQSLSTHPYRYGAASGSQGQVWDKVGFLWEYIHDAAIVHHPKGRYVVVIMTKDRSYGTIAAITRDIERIMYP